MTSIHQFPHVLQFPGPVIIFYMLRKNSIPLIVVAFHTIVVICLALIFGNAARLLYCLLDLPVSLIVTLIWNASVLIFPSINSINLTGFQVTWFNALFFAIIGGTQWFLIFKYGLYLVNKYVDRIPLFAVALHTLFVLDIALGLAKGFDPTDPEGPEVTTICWLFFMVMDLPSSLIVQLIFMGLASIFPSITPSSEPSTEFNQIWGAAIFFVIVGGINWFLIFYFVPKWWRWRRSQPG